MLKYKVNMALLALVLMLVSVVPSASASAPASLLSATCRAGVASTLYYKTTWYTVPRAIVNGVAVAEWRGKGGSGIWNEAPWSHQPNQEFYCLPGAEWRVKIQTTRGWRTSNIVTLDGSNSATATIVLWYW
jgi:hypothetical protein